MVGDDVSRAVLPRHISHAAFLGILVTTALLGCATVTILTRTWRHALAGVGCVVAPLLGAALGASRSERASPGLPPGISSVNRATVALPNYDWDTSRLTHTYYRNERAGLHWWLENEVKENPHLRGTLEGLAQAIQKQADGVGTTIYEYSRRGQYLWAAGAYTTSHKWASGAEYSHAKEEDKRSTDRGFICYSGDNGSSWERQWFSGDTGPEPVYGVYFSDSREGWALTFQGILHTNDSGVSWRKVFKCGVDEPNFHPGNLFILGDGSLIVRGSENFLRIFYTSKDRGLSWDKVTVTSREEYHRQFDSLVEGFGRNLVHYGGIYSKEGADK